MTKILYDLHIHSALSPCADNDMTPVNIGAMSSAKGLQIIAVADHNAIANVAAAREVGEALDVIVVPAVELQTQEDVHILSTIALNFSGTFDEISFKDLKNREEIFGEQLIVSSDDEVIGREERLLLAGANLSEPDIKPLVEKHGGVAVPAHVNRDANGIVAILGDVPDYYTAVELSSDCDEETAAMYAKKFRLIFDSDSHTLSDIGKTQRYLEINEISERGILSYLRGE